MRNLFVAFFVFLFAVIIFKVDFSVAADFEEGDMIKFRLKKFGNCSNYDWNVHTCRDAKEGVQSFFIGTITKVTKNKYKLEQTNYLFVSSEGFFIGKIHTFNSGTFSAKEPVYIKKDKKGITIYNPDIDNKGERLSPTSNAVTYRLL